MNTSYDKQLILDFIEWCEENKNIFLFRLDNESFEEN